MSGKPILHILKDAQEAWRKECPAPNDKYLPPGLVYYIKEIILDPNEDEDILEANLADLIIELLGRNIKPLKIWISVPKWQLWPQIKNA